MMFFLAGLFLGSSVSTADLRPVRCFHERYPAGTGVPMDRAAVKADRNLIVAVDQLIDGRGKPRKGTAASLGYILHIANGDLYYEPESDRTPLQQRAELDVLTKSHAFVTGDARQVAAFIAIGSSGIAKLVRFPTRGLTNELRIERCTTIKNPR